MRTDRSLSPSRAAIAPVPAASPVTSSSNQPRARAIPATRRARASDRMGREVAPPVAWLGGTIVVRLVGARTGDQGTVIVWASLPPGGTIVSASGRTAIIKHAALNIIQAIPDKASLAVRRKTAAWDDDYLFSALNQSAA